MKIPQTVEACFLSRPNRFIAMVEVEGTPIAVHVKNTGRCRELLVPGCRVYLSRSENPLRKTAYDLICVEKERKGRPPLRINMDSQAPNDLAEEWLPRSGIFSSAAVIRREVSWGNSRFDFYVEDGARRAFLEVKGCTLEHQGVARFPDAPTERGVKHLRELIACRDAGYEAYVLFVVQMKEIREFRPNDATDPAFGKALRLAAQSGVTVLAMDCCVQPDEIFVDCPVPVCLEDVSHV